MMAGTEIVSLMRGAFGIVFLESIGDLRCDGPRKARREREGERDIRRQIVVHTANTGSTLYRKGKNAPP
jgi:hypothetical protein